MSKKKTDQDWIVEGFDLGEKGKYEEAISSFDEQLN